MVVDLDRFTKMRNQFTSRYFLSGCNPNFGGQEIQVSWNSFSLAIQNFMNAASVSKLETAIRFVNCYDSVQNILYARMQILTMQPVKGNILSFNLIDTPSAWYQLTNGTLLPTTDTSLYDQSYFNNFYYCDTPGNCDPSTLIPLSSDVNQSIFTRTVTMPWLELQQLYTDNGQPVNATLCIDAASRLSVTAPECKFQHGLVCYLRKHDGTPMLDNEETGRAFHNKAADMGTLCPNYCNVYILPVPRIGEENEE